MKIDLNCDMGEGCGNDAELMRYVSSANIACGAHAGDHDTMKRTVDLAVEHGVAIGAHPGYRDRDNFGRTEMLLSAENIRDLVTEQTLALKAVAEGAGARLTHVKPHGALYNQAARDQRIAGAIASAVKDVDPSLVLFGLSDSVSIVEGKRLGLSTASEVFADRTYTSNGSLTPRTEPNAMISSTEAAVEQVIRIIRDHTAVSTSGSLIPIVAETVCIHGDGSNAVEFAEALSSALRDRGIRISSVSKK